MRQLPASYGSDDIVRLRNRLRRDGILFFRRLLPPDDVNAVRRDTLFAISQHGWLAAGTDPLLAFPSQPRRYEPIGPDQRNDTENDYFSGYKAIQSLESLHRLAHAPAVLSVLASLFGTEILCHPRKIARAIWPDEPDLITPAHQDFPLVGGTVDFFTLWVPLGSCPRALGGLRLLRGSHRLGLVHTEPAPGAGGVRLRDVKNDNPEWMTADFEAGDAVLFHSLIAHAGMPNTADRIRLSVDYRYQPASEPVTHMTLAPHFYDRLPDLAPWSEFTAGWQSTTWISVPDNIRVIRSGILEVFNRSGALAENAGTRGGKSQYVDTDAFAAQVAESQLAV